MYCDLKTLEYFFGIFLNTFISNWIRISVLVADSKTRITKLFRPRFKETLALANPMF